MYSETIETLVEFFLNGEPIAYFLSGYYDNKQFEIELNETADDLFYKYINSNSRLSEIERAKIIVSLTYISQKEYVDGTILPVFRQKYKRSSSSCSDVTFDKYIRSLLEDYRDKIKYFDRTQYVAVPLVACVLPHSYANKLMSIYYDIYKKSLLLDSDLTDIQIKLRIQDIFKRMTELKI